MKLVPPRILVFCWLALLQNFLTLDELETRKHIIVNGCPLCLTDEETANHLLIHSSFATRIWSFVLYRFGVQWVMPRIISELFQQWKITCNILSETTVFLYKVQMRMKFSIQLCGLYQDGQIMTRILMMSLCRICTYQDGRVVIGILMIPLCMICTWEACFRQGGTVKPVNQISWLHPHGVQKLNFDGSFIKDE